MAKAVAFDEIDKAPEEKARGITIATAHGGWAPLAPPARPGWRCLPGLAPGLLGHAARWENPGPVLASSRP